MKKNFSQALGGGRAPPPNEGFVSLLYTCRHSLALRISSPVSAPSPRPPYHDARLARSGSGGPRHSRSCAAIGYKRNLRPTVTTPLLPSARVQCSCTNSLNFASFVWTFWNALWNAAAPACTCSFCQLSRCGSVEAANFWHMRAALKLFSCKLQSREQLPADVYGRP